MKKKKTSLKVIIYLPNEELLIEKSLKETKKQKREIEDAKIVEEYTNKIKDRELPLFIQDY
jgi:hypothetical protein